MIQSTKHIMYDSPLKNGENYLIIILWKDESNFTLNGEVNFRNLRIWATSNSQKLVETPLQSDKIFVCCGFTALFKIGPVFFQEHCSTGLKIFTIKCQRYNNHLSNVVPFILQECNALNFAIFIHYRASHHTARQLMLLRTTFIVDLLPSKHSTHEWPERSSDHTLYIISGNGDT